MEREDILRIEDIKRLETKSEKFKKKTRLYRIAAFLSLGLFVAAVLTLQFGDKLSRETRELIGMGVCCPTAAISVGFAEGAGENDREKRKAEFELGRIRDNI